MPVQAATISAMSSAATSSLSSVPGPPAGGHGRLLLGQPVVQLLERAVLELGGGGEVGLALGLLDADLERLDLRLGRPDRGDRGLLGLPALLERAELLLEVGELLLERRQARLRRVVGLLAQGLALDLELDAPALELVELDGHRVDLHAQARRGLVDEVDGLVGQEAVGDVAVRQGGRGDERGVGDPDAVVDLVALAQPAQDRDGVLDARLVDEDGLEAPLEGGVLLDVLAVLVERRRADGVQLAAGEHRLQQVGGVHRALGRARADDRVQLVDEQDDLAVGVLDLLEDGLEPLLELAAELGARDQRAEVERDDALVLEALGHVAAHDALGEPLDDGRLADARLADQHRVVLRPTGQDLDDAADLLVAADDRVELARPRLLVRSRPYFSSAWYVPSGFCDVTRWPPRTLCRACRMASLPAAWRSRSAWPSPPASATPSSRCSVETYSSPSRRASSSARSMTVLARGSSAQRAALDPGALGEDRRDLAAERRAGRPRGGGASRPGRRHRARPGRTGDARRRAWGSAAVRPCAGRRGRPPGPSG